MLPFIERVQPLVFYIPIWYFSIFDYSMLKLAFWKFSFTYFSVAFKFSILKFKNKISAYIDKFLWDAKLKLVIVRKFIYDSGDSISDKLNNLLWNNPGFQE